MPPGVDNSSQPSNTLTAVPLLFILFCGIICLPESFFSHRTRSHHTVETPASLFTPLSDAPTTLMEVVPAVPEAPEVPAWSRKLQQFAAFSDRVFRIGMSAIAMGLTAFGTWKLGEQIMHWMYRDLVERGVGFVIFYFGLYGLSLTIVGTYICRCLTPGRIQQIDAMLHRMYLRRTSPSHRNIQVINWNPTTKVRPEHYPLYRKVWDNHGVLTGWSVIITLLVSAPVMY